MELAPILSRVDPVLHTKIDVKKNPKNNSSIKVSSYQLSLSCISLVFLMRLPPIEVQNINSFFINRRENRCSD